jgi:hypothetical protein
VKTAWLSGLRTETAWLPNLDCSAQMERLPHISENIHLRQPCGFASTNIHLRSRMFVLFLVHAAVLPVSRRPRVLGTAAAMWRREVACGIDPTRALVRALAEFRAIRPTGEVWIVGVGRDRNCPAIDTGPMAACTCELVRLEARRAG